MHYNDFHQGSQTPAAQESNRLIGEFLSDTGNDTTPMIESAFIVLRQLVWEYVYTELLDPELRTGWREDRAYGVSDLVPPLYIFQQ